MKKFEELLAKRDSEIEEEEKARRVDRNNYYDSIVAGLFGTLAGLVIGFVVYICVELVCEILWSNKYAILIFIISMLLGGIIGWYSGFTGTRNK